MILKMPWNSTASTKTFFPFHHAVFPVFFNYLSPIQPENRKHGLGLGLIHNARAVDGLFRALHPGSGQPTLSPTQSECLIRADAKQLSCKKYRAPYPVAQEHENDTKLSRPSSLPTCTPPVMSRLCSRRDHHRAPFLRTSVNFLARRVAIECVRGMASSVSTLACPNMISWSPASTSKSSFPTCTPLAISELCLLMRTNTSQS